MAGSNFNTAPLAPGATPEAIRREAYVRCIRWLGQRDHSSVELARKLEAREVEESIVESVLQELREARYVDDERFAFTLAEQRSRRGYGPRYISAKLVERGIERSRADIALETLEADWQAVACEALSARFHGDQLADSSQRQQARMARFLQSRGFSTGDSLRAIRQVVAAHQSDSCPSGN